MLSKRLTCTLTIVVVGLLFHAVLGIKLDITELRLANGIGLDDGRIEILVNGTWGTICSTSFDKPEANVVCRILFGTEYWNWELSWQTSSDYGSGAGPIYIDKLDCAGTETDINECSYSLDVTCPDHSHDAAVACNVFPLNITNTRLINGTGIYDGRIELFVDGHWGTIDRRTVNLYDAQTICNTHGSSLAMYFDTLKYGKGTGPILVYRIRCNSKKNDINSCTMYAPMRPFSSHQFDLSIVCTPCGLPDTYNGDPVAFTGNELTVSCQSGFSPNQVKMKCIGNNTWSQEHKCTPNYGYPLNISDIQLRNGYRPSGGRVEIKVNGVWGTICDTNFDSDDATVICKMLGLQYDRHYGSHFLSERGSGPIYVNNLNCTGKESHINQCSYDISNNCTHYDDMVVICTEWPLNITGIRLADGPSRSIGRVELKSNDEWGTVCNDMFGMQEADAVCSMLGYPPAVRYLKRAYFGRGTGPIFVDDLNCDEDASHINDCYYRTYGKCNHGDGVSVVCTGCGDPTPEYGFVNSSMTSYGAVVHVKCEVNYNLIGDFDIICKKNGSWSNVPTCKLIDCGIPKPASGNTNTTRTTNATVASVWCNNGYKLSGDSVIVCKPNGAWSDYPICEIIDCGDPTPKHGYVSSSMTHYGAVVHVTCEDSYDLIGDFEIICKTNGSWSNVPTCKLIDCGVPKPANGNINTTITTNATVASVWCNNGYKLSGDSVIVCKPNGAWSDYPICEIIDCGVPKPANGNINTTITTITTVASVWCNNGYKLSGDSVIVCKPNGAWSDYPICEIIDCGVPKPANGNINTTITTNATVASVLCNNGYKLSGDSVIVCKPNGAWSDYPICEIIDCGIPKPVNGNINTTITTNATVAPVWCDRGDSVMLCKRNGAWSDYPNCEIFGYCYYSTYRAKAWPCSTTIFPEANFANVELHDNKTTLNETAIIKCWTGYTPSVKTSVTCLSNGTWEKWPECELAGLSSNPKETTNIGVIVGVGVGSAVVTLLIVVIVCVTKRCIRTKSQRNHEQKQPENLPDVRTGNEQMMLEQISSAATNSPVFLNETPETEHYYDTPNPLYEELQERAMSRSYE